MQRDVGRAGDREIPVLRVDLGRIVGADRTAGQIDRAAGAAEVDLLRQTVGIDRRAVLSAGCAAALQRDVTAAVYVYGLRAGRVVLKDLCIVLAARPCSTRHQNRAAAIDRDDLIAGSTALIDLRRILAAAATAGQDDATRAHRDALAGLPADLRHVVVAARSTLHNDGVRGDRLQTRAGAQYVGLRAKGAGADA